MAICCQVRTCGAGLDGGGGGGRARFSEPEAGPEVCRGEEDAVRVGGQRHAVSGGDAARFGQFGGFANVFCGELEGSEKLGRESGRGMGREEEEKYRL